MTKRLPRAAGIDFVIRHSEFEFDSSFVIRISSFTVLWVVLCVFLPALAAEKQEAPRHEVSIESLQFKPATLTIKAGEKVIWTNNDDRDHTVIAKGGGFKSGVIHRGESFSFSFEKSGNFAYGCRLHPRMKGMIVVEPPKPS